jgi:hypothetical protein
MAKIRQSNIDDSIITGNTELSASAAGDDVLLVYDTSAGVIKKIQSSNVGLQAPAISSISPTNVLSGDGTGNYTITITGSGFTADATAKLTTDGGTDITFDSVTRNSSTQLTCVIAKNTANLTNANEPFDVTVTTVGALTTTSADAITIDASPVFVTASGSLGSNTLEETSGTYYVNATDPESAGNVTFELQSGSLPPNFTLTNSAADGGTAVISGTAGTVAANTTYNFTLRAIDAASNTTSRAFSITIQNNPVSESFTSSGTFSVPAGITTADVLVVAGGGGGGEDGGGGGGAGGLVFFPEYPVTAGGTVTVTVGCGGIAGARGQGTCALYGGTGGDSIFGSPGDPGFTPTSSVLTAKGGGGGGGGPEGPRQGNPGGSGGGGNGHGASYQSYSGAGSATQPTQPGNSGAYGFGNGGGQGIHTGQTPQNHLSAGGGGGAGAAGQSGNYNGPTAAGGGAGRAYTIADGTTPVYYAGGGSGTTNGVGPGAFARPLGGGGQCGPAGAPTGGNDGLANRGGGGGADGNPAGVGGKGVVIIRY